MSEQERYKRQLDEIKASEAFKSHTLNRLRLAQEIPDMLTETPKASRLRLPRVWRRGLAGVSVALFAVLCWQVGGPLLNSGVAVPVEPEAQSAAPRTEAPPPSAPVSSFVASSSQPVTTTSQTEKKPSDYFSNEAPAAAQADSVIEHVETTTSLPSVQVPEYTAPPPEADPTPEQAPPADLLVDYGKEDVTHTDTETEPPTELPVYSAPEEPPYDESGLVDIVEKQAAALGMTVDSYGSTEEAPVEADCGDATIQAQADGSVRIRFFTPLETEAATAEDVDVDALLDEYSELLAGMQQPVAETLASVYSGGRIQRSVNIYDGGDDDTGTVFSRTLSGARLLLDEEGNVTAIQLWRADTFEKLGSYPLLSEEAAVALLAEGGGFTSLPTPFPGTEYIEAVGLEYLYTGTESYVLPYYKFYVALPDADCALFEGVEADSLTGVWYLPAIAQEYIE